MEMTIKAGTFGWKRWLARILTLIVLAWNLEAAISFMVSPALYLAGFELKGSPGEVAVAGIGLLFLMWQVPYVLAVVGPLKFRVSLIEALVMQTIGLVGESILLTRITSEHAMLRSSITRFIVFDGTGVVLLGVALVLVWWRRSKKEV
jgi:hypothetical protein